MSIPTYRGQTIPVISFPVNWADGMKWRQSYSTTITEALDLGEERQGRLPRALYSLTYSTVGLTAAETAYLRRVIETADDLPVACPLWPLACQLTAAATAGDTRIATDDPEDCLFQVFTEYALIWESFDQWEVVELFYTHTSGFILNAALTGNYSTAALVMPLAYGHVPRGPVDQLTDEHGIWECQFSEKYLGLHDQSIVESDTDPLIDIAPCAVSDLTGGGGDLFDCYPDGAAASMYGGTGLVGGWVIGDNPFNNVQGDEFTSYADGAFASQANSGTGLTGNWIVGDGP